MPSSLITLKMKDFRKKKKKRLLKTSKGADVDQKVKVLVCTISLMTRGKLSEHVEKGEDQLARAVL